MKSTQDFKHLVETCDADLRAGRIDRVHAVLTHLPAARVPSHLRLPLARICRRAGLISMGLRLLSPRVRPDKLQALHPPEPAEIAEYAVLLIRAGAVREAQERLSKINPERAPEALLYRAFAHFAQWEYDYAIPHLENYLRAPLAPYELFVGRVNLAAALVGTKQTLQAEPLLLENIRYASAHKHTRLEANCFEMLAQVHFQKQDYMAALHALDRSAKTMGAHSANDHLFVRKWRAIVEAVTHSNTEPILKFRAEALQRKEWESVREADFYELHVAFEQEKFDRIYFGTPFSGYRTKLCRELNAKASCTHFDLGDGQRRLNLSSPADAKELKGQSAHQLIEVLLRDFYSPCSLGTLFADLYPAEYFNIFSSPGRVHQALRRTRKWIEAKGLDLKIINENGRYRMHVGPALCVRLGAERERVDRNVLKLNRIRDVFGTKAYFGSQEVLNELDMSRAALKRFLNWALANGKLRRFGESRATRYYFAA